MFREREGRAGETVQPRWPVMLILSALIHLCGASLILLVPNTIPSRGVDGDVYEVNLVDLPRKLGAPAPAPKSEELRSPQPTCSKGRSAS